LPDTHNLDESRVKIADLTSMCKSKYLLKHFCKKSEKYRNGEV